MATKKAAKKKTARKKSVAKTDPTPKGAVIEIRLPRAVAPRSKQKTEVVQTIKDQLPKLLETVAQKHGMNIEMSDPQVRPIGGGRPRRG